MSTERRSETRRRIAEKVEVVAEFTGRSFLASAKDISASGMFIATEEPLVSGDFVRVNFALPGTTSFISLEAQVVRVVRPGPGVEAGAGLRFLDAPEWVITEIRRFVLTEPDP